MPTVSQSAEKNLISDLLDMEVIRNPLVQKRLAYYAYADINEKNEIICELMDFCWKQVVQIDIFPFFKQFDFFMTASGKRGHFIHQFEVFLLGLNLIKRLWKTRHGKDCLGSDFKVVFYTWLMAATAHDLGRALELAPVIARELSKLYAKLNMFDLSRFFGRVPSERLAVEGDSLLNVTIGRVGDTLEQMNAHPTICASIRDSLMLSEAEAVRLGDALKEQNNHGYISAAILFKMALESLVVSKGSYANLKTNWRYTPLLKAVGAIALHALHKSTDPSLKDYIKHISFDNNPFAFLLVVIDNIQDWSRPTIEVKEWPTYNLAAFSSSESEIKLQYVLTHDEWDMKTKTEVETALDEKRLITGAKGPSESLKTKVVITFEANSAVLSLDMFNLELAL